jgi:hypothetical protein
MRFRTRQPGPGVYTFWDYQAGAWERNNGIRIDHVLLSPQAADRLEEVRHRQGRARGRQAVRPRAGLDAAGGVAQNPFERILANSFEGICQPAVSRHARKASEA